MNRASRLLFMRQSSNSPSASMSTKVGGTFSKQSSLPKLPIPSLSQTAVNYLKTTRPLQNDSEFNKTKELVHDFIKPNGLGEILQNRLVEYGKKQKYSWLEVLWLEKAYHEYREPCLINVNWWMLMRDQVAVSAEGNAGQFESAVPSVPNYTLYQVKKTANIIYLACKYNQLIINEQLPIETNRDTPLCMNQYKSLFSVTRIPKEKCDYLHFGDSSKIKHISVLVNDQIFKVDVIDKQGRILGLTEIEDQLKKCIAESQNNVQPAISVLTSAHRDFWTIARNYLVKKSKNNVNNLKMIEDSLFNVSLESTNHLSVTDNSRQIFCGKNGHNLWFDKSLSFIVTANGKVGLNGEHSPCDAVVPYNIMQYIYDNENKAINENQQKSTFNLPAKLVWDCDKVTLDHIKKAELDAIDLINDTEVCVLHLPKFNSTFFNHPHLKKIVKTGSDAWIQACLQLTFYRLHGRFAPTYETAATRKFLHGRTECIRPLSQEQVNFVKTMCNNQATTQDKLKSFMDFAQSHRDQAIRCSDGLGVDRHFLGLRCMMKEGERHPIFEDPVFNLGRNFELSTSNMSPSTCLDSLGFGPGVPTGYGINYCASTVNTKISITAKNSEPSTSAEKFKSELVKSFEELSAIAFSNNQQSKL